MDLDQPFCSKCGKSDQKLLHCAMCHLHAHPDCILIDFPKSDVADKQNWICQFCKVMDPDLIIFCKLRKSSRTFSVKYEGGVPKDYFQFKNTDPRSEKGAQLETDDTKYFCNFEDKTHSACHTFDLVQNFPLEDGHYLGDETGEMVITIHDERLTDGFLMLEESFNSEEDYEDLNNEGLADGFSLLENSFNTQEDSENLNNDGVIVKNEWVLDRVDGPDTCPEFYIVSDCIEISEHFFVEWTENGTKIVKSCEQVERERRILSENARIQRKAAKIEARLEANQKKRIKYAKSDQVGVPSKLARKLETGSQRKFTVPEKTIENQNSRNTNPVLFSLLQKTRKSVDASNTNTVPLLLPKTQVPETLNRFETKLNETFESIDLDEAARTNFFEEHLHCYQICEF